MDEQKAILKRMLKILFLRCACLSRVALGIHVIEMIVILMAMVMVMLIMDDDDGDIENR